MKKIVGILLLGIVLIISGQKVNAQKYGYLNKDELYKAMPDYDSATVKIEKIRKEYESQLAGMQNELNSKTATLNESSNISDFLRQSKQDELKNLNVRIQLFSVRATSQLDENQNLLLRPIVARVDKAINDVAKEQGFVFVLDGTQLIFADDKKCMNILPLVKVKLGLK